MWDREGPQAASGHGVGEAKRMFGWLAALFGPYLDGPGNGLLVDRMGHAALRETLSPHLDHPGHGDWRRLLQAMEAYLAQAVRTQDPLYLNQLWAGRSLPALAGEILAAVSNTSLYTYEVAPAATAIEIAMLAELKRIIGFPEGEAQMTTGGSNGNMLGLMLARDRASTRCKQEGLWNRRPLAAFVSAEAHYSFDKAAAVLGLGANAIIKVKVDRTGAMDMDALAEAIAAARAGGCEPFFVAATAGTTVRGAFDPIPAMADIAAREGLWLHVDGAWGGAFILSERHRHLLDGLQRADSFVWDAHKMLGVPLMCSMLFCRHRGAFHDSFALGDTSYIFHEAEDRPDLGPDSILCGRRVDILKLWLEWQYYGPAGLAKRVDRYVALAERAEAIVAAEPRLELQTPRRINTLCFRYRPGRAVDLDAFNRSIRDRLGDSGRALVNFARIDGALTIRLVICNPAMTEADVDQFFALVLETGREMEAVG